jgi:DNA-binding transcriptional regulator YiaG
MTQEKTTGAAIREMRRRAGLNQDEVARAWGSYQMILSMTERGFRPTSEEEFEAIRAAIISVLQSKAAKLLELAENLKA